MVAITSSAGTLDVNSLVTQLVAAERGPQDTRLAATKSKINVTLSAIGTFKSTLATLLTASEALKTSGSAFGRLSTTISTEGYFTAAASSSAAAGRYEIEVVSLAKAHKVASAPFGGGASSVVGDGTVSIAVGGESFDVTLASPSNTLADLRDAINAAQDNTGVTATLLTEDGGTRLMLTSQTAGTAKQIVVTTSLFTTAQAQPASNAQIKIDDFTYTGTSNTITGALEGVTLDLTKAEPGTKISLDISADRAGASTAIQEMVRAYNAMVAVVKRHGSYDPATKTGGPLMGDASVRSAMQQVRSILGAEYGTGEFSMMAQLGVSTQADGTLNIDTAKLNAALAKDPDAVREMFTGTDRIADRLTTTIESFLGSEGRIEAQTDRLQKRLDLIADQTEALDRRMELMRARYLKQFTALDTLLSQMQTTSDSLAQQLANLPTSSS